MAWGFPKEENIVLSKSILPILLVSLLGGVALSLPADQDDLLEDIGLFTPQFFAELQDVELAGDRAYVFGVGGMTVLDVSDPQNPIQLGRYEPPGHPYNRFYRGAVEGSLALGGGREDLLSVMTMAGPGNPDLLTVYGQPGQSFEHGRWACASPIWIQATREPSCALLPMTRMRISSPCP